MARFEYPGETFVGPPLVVLETPDGWGTLLDASAVMAVIRDQVEGEAFTPNVIVQHLRFLAGYTLGNAISAVDAAMDALDDLQDGGRDAGEQFGVPTYVREAGFRLPNVGTLIQHVRVLTIENGPFVDVIQVTGTASGGTAVADLPDIRGIADSVSVSVSLS